MKYKVNVNGKNYEVEIEDINARPVVARVDGKRFEVVPENGEESASAMESRETAFPAGLLPSASKTSINIDEITAPLPGTVIEVFIKPGDQVETGQVVLIIEAMKMKNSIRATRGGMVKEVLIDAGQSVAHKQPLVRFTE